MDDYGYDEYCRGWNGFVQWVAFGGKGVIRQNNREEQRKIIRYNHLLANLVAFTMSSR